MAEWEREERERFKRLEAQVTSLETSLLRVPATTAVVLLLVGVVTPMFVASGVLA